MADLQWSYISVVRAIHTSTFQHDSCLPATQGICHSVDECLILRINVRLNIAELMVYTKQVMLIFSEHPAGDPRDVHISYLDD